MSTIQLDDIQRKYNPNIYEYKDHFLFVCPKHKDFIKDVTELKNKLAINSFEYELTYDDKTSKAENYVWLVKRKEMFYSSPKNQFLPSDLDKFYQNRVDLTIYITVLTRLLVRLNAFKESYPDIVYYQITNDKGIILDAFTKDKKAYEQIKDTFTEIKTLFEQLNRETPSVLTKTHVLMTDDPLTLTVQVTGAFILNFDLKETFDLVLSKRYDQKLSMHQAFLTELKSLMCQSEKLTLEIQKKISEYETFLNEL